MEPSPRSSGAARMRDIVAASTSAASRGRFWPPQNWRNYRISSDKNECTGVRRSRISELHRAQEETSAVKEWRSCAARQRRTQRLSYIAVFTQISCSWQCSATTECLAKAREANNSPFQHPGASRAANHFAQHWQQQLTSAHGNPEGPRSPIPCNVLLQTLVVATALKKL